MRILEEFWYGNIEPTEYDTSSTAYKKLLELICRKTQSHHDGRAKRVVRKIHQLYARVSNHHGLLDISKQL